MMQGLSSRAGAGRLSLTARQLVVTAEAAFQTQLCNSPISPRMPLLMAVANPTGKGPCQQVSTLGGDLWTRGSGRDLWCCLMVDRRAVTLARQGRAPVLLALARLGSDGSKPLHSKPSMLISTCGQDANLRHTLQFGIGLHHAGLVEADRDLVESLYVGGRIQVCCWPCILNHPHGALDPACALLARPGAPCPGSEFRSHPEGWLYSRQHIAAALYVGDGMQVCCRPCILHPEG